MTTVSTKKICVKCVKGTGIVTCDGCYQSFCHKHLLEHRQELLQQMDQIHDQCEHFRKGLSQQHDPSLILSDIDLWEQESIEKIHLAAESLRTDVRQLNERTVNDFNQAVNKITTSMKSSRQANDVTEPDLTAWTDQLQTLQDLLKQPFPISLISDEKRTSTFRFIKVKYESPLTNFTHGKVKPKQHLTIKYEPRASDSQQVNTSIDEKFYRVAGHAILSEDGLTATSFGYSSVCGIKLYGRGIHSIRFRIIAKKNEGIFFGILTSTQEITARAPELPSVYGWRDFDRTIVNGNAQLKARQENNIQPGDQITLTVDCDHAKLALSHHQLNRRIQLSIDVHKCPFPWRLVVSSYGEDTIAILH